MIAAIEWDSDGRVCRVVALRDFFQPSILDILARGSRYREQDINYCRRDDIHYHHETGCWTGRIYLGKLVEGCRHRLWAADNSTFSNSTDGEMLSADEIKELGYDLEYGPKPTLPYSEEGSCYYCERCNDMIPDRDHCDHVFWCDDCGVLQDKKTEACEHYCEQHEVQLSMCEWSHD